MRAGRRHQASFMPSCVSSLFITISFLVHNVGYPRAIGAVSVINHFYGRDDITLGAFKGTFGQNIKGESLVTYFY